MRPTCAPSCRDCWSRRKCTRGCRDPPLHFHSPTASAHLRDRDAPVRRRRSRAVALRDRIGRPVLDRRLHADGRRDRADHDRADVDRRVRGCADDHDRAGTAHDDRHDRAANNRAPVRADHGRGRRRRGQRRSAAPHNGDNNEDGIADAEQTNVASLPSALDVDGNGELDDYVTIVSPAGTSLHDVNAVSVPSDNPPPDGVTLPYGLFDYDVQVANPGASAAVTYITPAGFVPDGVHFLQHGAWSDLADRTAVDATTGDATVQLQDGGAGDASPATDAVIADPSGPSTRDRSITVAVASGAGAQLHLQARVLPREQPQSGQRVHHQHAGARRAGHEQRPGSEHRARQHRRLELGRHRVHAAEPEPALPPLGDDAPAGVGLEPHQHQLHRRRSAERQFRPRRPRGTSTSRTTPPQARPAPRPSDRTSPASRCTRRATTRPTGR